MDLAFHFSIHSLNNDPCVAILLRLWCIHIWLLYLVTKEFLWMVDDKAFDHGFIVDRITFVYFCMFLQKVPVSRYQNLWSCCSLRIYLYLQVVRFLHEDIQYYLYHQETWQYSGPCNQSMSKVPRLDLKIVGQRFKMHLTKKKDSSMSVWFDEYWGICLEHLTSSWLREHFTQSIIHNMRLSIQNVTDASVSNANRRWANYLSGT